MTIGKLLFLYINLNECDEEMLLRVNTLQRKGVPIVLIPVDNLINPKLRILSEDLKIKEVVGKEDVLRTLEKFLAFL